MTQQVEARRPKGRSPSYPGIDLAEAIERARTLYREEGKHPAPVETILGHWGYKPKSGPGWTALAALKKFGLVTDEGSGESRKAKLTDEALNIILDDRDDQSERMARIRRAALEPTIHQELWEKFGGRLPSDRNLRFELTRERNFTDSGADEFIKEFKATIEFAQLTPGDNIGDKPEDKGEAPMTPAATEKRREFSGPPWTNPTPAPTTPPAPPSDLIHTPMKLRGGILAAIDLPPVMTEEAWKQMLTLLGAMKDGYVVEPDDSPPSPVAIASQQQVEDDEASEGLTTEARELLSSIDENSVPAYMTPNLERIAHENGVEVRSDMTPNQVIDALLQKALDE